MSSHVSELLADYALNALTGAEHLAVEAHLGECGQCVAELVQIQAALTVVGTPLPATPPSATARQRLLDAIAAGGRFDDFAERVAELFDLPASKARDYLDRLDDPARWMVGPGHGVFMLPVRPGPRAAGTMSGFVKVAPGSEFPHHTHNGDETNIVLQGACADPDGTVYRRHMQMEFAAGSAHSFTAIEDVDFIVAVRLAGGFTLG